jgi:hypothetical protein
MRWIPGIKLSGWTARNRPQKILIDDYILVTLSIHYETTIQNVLPSVGVQRIHLFITILGSDAFLLFVV